MKMATLPEKLAQDALHPIQLSKALPFAVQFRGLREPHPDLPDPDFEDVTISSGHSDYDAAKKRILVVLGVHLMRSAEEEEGQKALPYEFRVEMAGEFRVREEMDAAKLTRWANAIAPYVLFPYLRAFVSNLTRRCGYRPFDLPLLVLPTGPDREKPQKRKTSKKASSKKATAARKSKRKSSPKTKKSKSRETQS